MEIGIWEVKSFDNNNEQIKWGYFDTYEKARDFALAIIKADSQNNGYIEDEFSEGISFEATDETCTTMLKGSQDFWTDSYTIYVKKIK